MLAKVWRFVIYRDSGPTLILDRLQQVEHEAYLTLMAERSGVLVPDVLAAGRVRAQRGRGAGDQGARRAGPGAGHGNRPR